MSDTQRIVQALRAAKTLAERAYEMTRPAELGMEAMSHRLSELRQLYPQIWSLLDDARRELAALGKDVSHYDALRAKPAASAGGVLDVQLGLDSSKRAAVNAEGVALATEGVYVLRALLPEIDWMGLEDAEAAELANIGSLAKPVSKVFLIGVIGVLAAIGVVVYVAVAG